jgi:hypothetical protein
MGCRHCGRGLVNRPRGLCWSCYYTPGLRERYPSTSKFARRGVGSFYGQVQLPPEPTMALPGTPEKVAVLEQRAHRHQALWHPQDAPRNCQTRLAGVA